MQKKIRFGVLGTLRGRSFIENIALVEGAELTAVCDMNRASLDGIKEIVDDQVVLFEHFDDFIESGLFDAVVLANFFCEHAPFAIRAMEKGIHVLSETTAALTMAECVELCRTVERTGCRYMLAENYPFLSANLEMKRIYESGKLGRALYCEGEYVHPVDKAGLNRLSPGRLHWRNWLPRTYYLTHALSPILHITGNMPVAVNTKSVFDPSYFKGTARKCADILSIMLCEMNDGSLARVTGVAAWGGHGNRYRICGEKGNVQNLPGSNEEIRLQYNEWDIPHGEQEYNTYSTQAYTDKKLTALAEGSGHGGGDFWVVYHFVNYLLHDIEPYFNVYRSCAMSAVGICGLLSSQNGGTEYRIPDFTKEEDRKPYEHHTASPFPNQNGQADMECGSKRHEPSKEDYAKAGQDWKEAGFQL